MKRILLPVAILIQYSSVVTTFRFEPMHAAPPISHGEFTGISLGKRQDCPFGVICGGGCAVLGPCCDEVTGFSCRDAEACTTINGRLGCCPVGTTCTTISSCLDATDPICVGGTGAPDNFFCCDTATPFCNMLGTAQLCQATMSPRSSSTPATSTAVTSSTAEMQSSMASSNWTITTNTASMPRNGTSAGTQQLIATIISQSFRPVNTSRIATTPTPSPTSTTTGTTVIYATTSTTVTISSGTSTTSVTDSLTRSSVASASLKTTSSSPILQLEPTETTISVAPLFTGGSTVGCIANEFTMAVFGLLLAVFL